MPLVSERVPLVLKSPENKPKDVVMDMGRPLKEGLDYFPLDCGFFRDRKIKLIKAEFGVTGVYVVLLMLSKAYEEHGYYLLCDEDELALIADECKLEISTVNEILKGCLRRSVFDTRVYESFRVLTSRGIQRRYLTAIGHNRKKVEFIREYLLLDLKSEDDFPNGIKKIFLNCLDTGEVLPANHPTIVSPGKTRVSTGETPVEPEKALGKVRKVKKSKVKESKEKGGGIPTTIPQTNDASSGFNMVKPPPPLTNPEFGEVIRFYQDHLSFDMPREAVPMLTAWLEAMGKEAMLLAMKEIEANTPGTWNGTSTWGFAKRVFQGWVQAGVHDVQSAKAHLNRRGGTSRGIRSGDAEERRKYGQFDDGKL